MVPELDSLALLSWLGAVLAAFASAFAAYLWRIVAALPSLQKGSVAFFHPFADGGGGGERVLWCAVKAVQEASPTAQVYIYVRDGVSADELRRDAMQRFNITIPRPVEVVPLRRTELVLPESYPRLTLLRQAVGSARLGRDALARLVPEVFVDTTGWAFTYPLAWLAGCKVIAYVHYPFVSSDMIGRVAEGRAMYNNDDEISGSPLLSSGKVLYYRALALLYGGCGACCHVAMANSSWTARHLRELWWIGPLLGRLRWWRRAAAPGVALVYPPCDTEGLQQLPLDRRLKKLFLVAVAQFRPEKNHALLLEAWAQTKANAGDDAAGQAVRSARLKIVGSCRGPADEARLAGLQELAQHLQIERDIDWCINVPFSELRQLLGDAVAGVHCMVDEHFGISVVEYLAAGAIAIANNSAGPREDIIVHDLDEEDAFGGVERWGYLASTAREYADKMAKVLAMGQVQRLRIAAAGRRHAARFSTQRFLDSFTSAVAPLLPGAVAVD